MRSSEFLENVFYILQITKFFFIQEIFQAISEKKLLISSICHVYSRTYPIKKTIILASTYAIIRLTHILYSFLLT